MARSDICVPNVYIRKYEQSCGKIHMKIRWDEVGELCNGAENQILHLPLLSARTYVHTYLMFGQTMGDIYAFVRQFIFVRKRIHSRENTSNKLSSAIIWKLDKFPIIFAKCVLNVSNSISEVTSVYQIKWLIQFIRANGWIRVHQSFIDITY